MFEKLPVEITFGGYSNVPFVIDRREWLTEFLGEGVMAKSSTPKPSPRVASQLRTVHVTKC